MANWPDIVNGGFELLGSCFTWRNFLQLRRDREVRGVYWPTTAFFAAWGVWNLIYYPALGQWASFTGGVLLVSGNLAWVATVVRHASIRARNTAQQRGRGHTPPAPDFNNQL